MTGNRKSETEQIVRSNFKYQHMEFQNNRPNSEGDPNYKFWSSTLFLGHADQSLLTSYEVSNESTK